MRAKLAGMCLFILLSGGVQAATTYSFPATFGTNPSGQWSLAYGSTSWSNANDLSAMTPNSSAPNWSSGALAPRVDGNLWVISGNTAWSDAGVLVFQAPLTGQYSIDTDWYAYGAEGDPTTEYLSVRVASNATSTAETLWSTSYYWPDGSGMVTSWDLGDVSELQNIELTAGSYVFFSMNAQTVSYYPTAYNRFFNDDGSLGGTITYVPEPCTVLLLLSGLLAAVRCRKMSSL
jgi:hypothetical protein